MNHLARVISSPLHFAVVRSNCTRSSGAMHERLLNFLHKRKPQIFWSGGFFRAHLKFMNLLLGSFINVLPKLPLRLFLSVLWGSLMLAGLAQATEIEKLNCFSTTFEPFVIDQDGSVSGIDVDVVTEAGRSIGVDVTFALMPWSRLESALQDGKVDCVAAYFRTPEREEYMHFTGVPLHITAYSFFVNVGDKPAYTSIQEVNGWTIGVNRGFKTTTEFEQAVAEKRITLVELNSTKQGFDMLRLKRLDAVLTNQHVGLYLTKLYHPGAFEALKPSLRATPAYLVFSKKEKLKQLVGRFNESLMELMTDGRYQKIFQGYTR